MFIYTKDQVLAHSEDKPASVSKMRGFAIYQLRGVSHAEGRWRMEQGMLNAGRKGTLSDGEVEVLNDGQVGHAGRWRVGAS